MDRRLSLLAGAALLLAVIVAVVLIAGTDDSENDVVAAEETEKPVVEVPAGAPPEELVVEDIEVGEGAEATAGDTVTVNYVGVLHEDGEEFDSSWEREPFEFELGANMVIEGWDQGVEGMLEGGRRQLVIPSEMGYGEAGNPPTIPGDAALVFVVDLISVN